MAAVFYSFIVNDVIPQNPELLQINLKKQKVRKKKALSKLSKLHYGTKLSYF